MLAWLRADQHLKPLGITRLPRTSPALPRDFLDEVEAELRRARQDVAESQLRIMLLEELRTLVAALVARLNRPITVIDVIDAAGERDEQERCRALVYELRRPVVGPPRQ